MQRGVYKIGDHAGVGVAGFKVMCLGFVMEAAVGRPRSRCPHRVNGVAIDRIEGRMQVRPPGGASHVHRLAFSRLHRHRKLQACAVRGRRRIPAQPTLAVDIHAPLWVSPDV